MHLPFSLSPQIWFFTSIFLTLRSNLWSSRSFFLNFFQKYSAHSHHKAGSFRCTLRRQYSDADCFLQVYVMKIRWVLDLAWVLHIRHVRQVWAARTFLIKTGRKVIWLGLTSFGNHTVEQWEDCRATLMALWKGSIRQGRQAPDLTSRPEVGTLCTSIAGLLRSQHWLMVPEHGKPAKSLLAPGKFLAEETRHASSISYSSIVPPQRSVQTPFCLFT